MKKTIILTLMLFIITGCDKKIVCKLTGNDDNPKTTQKYEIHYKNNSVTKIAINRTYEFKSKIAFEQFESLLNYTQPVDQENMQISYKKHKQTYNIIEIYNYEKLTPEEKDSIGYPENKSDLINDLKNQGLKCK